MLARLFADAEPPWLLKGGYALELRLGYRARATRDLDLSVPNPERLGLSSNVGLFQERAGKLHEYLQLASEHDPGDAFRFLIRAPRGELTGAPGGGVRCGVEARLDGRTFAQFHVDVGLGDAMLGDPEWVKGRPLLEFAGISAVLIPLVPSAQQFAEKIHAYTFPWKDRGNTRVKDLVDLVLLIQSGLLEAAQVRRALQATFRLRATHSLTTELPRPPEAWSESFLALATDLGLPVRDLEQAYAYLQAFWRDHGLDQVYESGGDG